MKSWSGLILKILISGSEITTLELPPNYSNLASISPNVLDTERRPGITLTGPIIYSPSSLKPCV